MRKVCPAPIGLGTHRGHNKVFLAAPRTPSSAPVLLWFVRVTFSHPAFTAVTRVQIPSGTPINPKKLHASGVVGPRKYVTLSRRHCFGLLFRSDHLDHPRLRLALGSRDRLRVNVHDDLDGRMPCRLPLCRTYFMGFAASPRPRNSSSPILRLTANIVAGKRRDAANASFISNP